MAYAPALGNRAQDNMLADWVQEAIACEELAQIEAKEGVWRSEMFEFCRVLKSCPLLAESNDLEAAEIVEKILRMRNPNEPDPWEAEFCDYEDAQASFTDNWNVVRFPAGMFEKAVLLARSSPFKPAGAASKGYCRFLSLCAWLQRLVGEQPIFVPVGKFGDALRVSAQ